MGGLLAGEAERGAIDFADHSAAPRARAIACRSGQKFVTRLWGGLWGELENAPEMPMKSAPTGGLPLRQPYVAGIQRLFLSMREASDLPHSLKNFGCGVLQYAREAIFSQITRANSARILWRRVS